MRLLFSKSASPHHGFATYYSFVEKIFKADAVLHFGSHGSLEFMPGKQVGMSDVCYPDSLIGNIPNVYYYAANNPSEATIAKRRSYANTISYLTPPSENAGLYKAKLTTLFEFLGECLKLIVAHNELGSLKQALEGKYVEPGPGCDPIRNPKVLPTGKTMHALDPQAIPTTASMQSAKVVVNRLIERQKADNGGKYPETVALVLWGTDNIKTYGESLAQVLWMIGVRPVADAFGRVNRVEIVSLEELGRPRIDVVVNCSGVFRDLFINHKKNHRREIEEITRGGDNLSYILFMKSI
ncbi:hypothetical protein Dsin_007378 [Dipteronia sinensis]|uniref:CobN/magnesium chelatase domain-containing protein n=1 Tax=Dipteronia sinensis TaxID=43782 RepID=A0AAE0B024_9ROSI|nr:hypothetical protein Dsin_007378 [Dipteronia sinensis]